MPWGHHRSLLPFLPTLSRDRGTSGTGVSCQSCRNTQDIPGGQRERLLLCLRAVSVCLPCTEVSAPPCTAQSRKVPVPAPHLSSSTELALPTTALENVLCSSTLKHCFLLCFLPLSPLPVQSPTVQSLFISHWSLCRTTAVPQPGSLRRKFNFL